MNNIIPANTADTVTRVQTVAGAGSTAQQYNNVYQNGKIVAGVIASQVLPVNAANTDGAPIVTGLPAPQGEQFFIGINSNDNGIAHFKLTIDGDLLLRTYTVSQTTQRFFRIPIFYIAK